MPDVLPFFLQYGLVLLFVIVFVEQIGVPIPAIPILIAAGALAGSGQINPWGVIVVTVLAAIAADWIWYELGRRRGRPVLGWLCRLALEPDSCVRKTEAFFTRHGSHALVMAKFIPGLSTIAPPLAGIAGFRLPIFLFFDGIGAMIWAGSSIGVGYAFSNRLEQAWAYADQLTSAAALAAFLTLAYVLGKALYRRTQLRKAPRMTVEELGRRLRSPDPPMLIDVRPHGTASAEPAIPNARTIPLTEIENRHADLPRDRELVLFCGCPGDAASAEGVLLLQRFGFSRVRALAGGVAAWQAQAL